MHCAGEVRQTLLVCRSKALFVSRATSAIASIRKIPHHVNVKENGIAIVVTMLPDKRKCPISLPFLSTTTLLWLPYAACGRSVKCLQKEQQIRSCIMSCSCYAQALVTYTYSCPVPFGSLMARRWNVSIMRSTCHQCCASHGTCKLLAVSPQQPSRATDATKLTPAEGIIAFTSLAGHD